MNTDIALGLLAGLTVGSGLALLIFGIRGSEPTPARPDGIPGLSALTPQALSSSLRRLVLALSLGVLALVVSSWPVFGIGVFLITEFSPIIIGGFFRSSGDTTSLEALAGWVESLRDVIAGAVGLEQALPATATTAGTAIAGPLAQLVERLRVRASLPEALARFADDLDDPSADLVVAALVLNARLRGPGLRDVLSALAISTREELDMRRRIEAQRRSTRRSVQVVVAVVVVVIVGLTVFNHHYVEPYNSALGQGVLAVVIGLFVAGFLWLKGLASFEVPDRFVTAESGQAVQAMTDRLVADTVATPGLAAGAAAGLRGGPR